MTSGFAEMALSAVVSLECPSKIKDRNKNSLTPASYTEQKKI
jgi:hypothetical protein